MAGVTLEQIYRAILPMVMRLERRADLLEDEIRTRVKHEALMLALGSGDAPRTRSVGNAKAARMLSEIGLQLVAIASALDQLPKEAFDAVEVSRQAIAKRRATHEAEGIFSIHDRPQHPYEVAIAARVLAEAIDAAETNLAAIPVMPQGRRPKLLAASVASMAMTLYVFVTGRDATVATDAYSRGHPAGGAFLELVNEMFQALGIDASAENQARKAIKKVA